MNTFKKFISGITYILIKDFKNIMRNLWINIGISFSFYQIVNLTIPTLFPTIKIPYWINYLFHSFPLYIIFIIISVIIREKNIFKYEITISNENSITLVVGDFMKNVEKFKHSNCIFGVNDSFNCDTSKLVHSSIHYQFMHKYFKNRFDEHQNEVNNFLNKNYVPCENDFNDITNRHYPPGTICMINFDTIKDNITGISENRCAFMIANSRLQSNYKAYRMTDSSINYPQKIWDFINSSGTSSDSLIIPLIGTSKNTGQVSKNKVVIQIIDSYFENISKGDIKDLIISIPEDDYIKRKLDIIMLRDYINSKSYIYNQKQNL